MQNNANHEITAQELRAIRHADTLCWFHNSQKFEGGDRSSYLKCIQDARNSSTGYEQNINVLINSRITNYEGGWANKNDHDYPIKGLTWDQITGYAYQGSVSVRQEVRTWRDFLRAGDVLTVEFISGNNSDVLREAGLSHDEAWLTIFRPKTQKGYRFFLEDSITRRWSSTRMVLPIKGA